MAKGRHGLGIAALVVAAPVAMTACNSPAPARSTSGVYGIRGFHPDVGNPTPAAPSSTTTAVPTTTTSTVPMPGPTTISVTGTGPASTITIDLSGQESQHSQAALPWSTQVPQDFTGNIEMNAQDGSGAGSATITCTISDNFGTLDTNTSTGPYSVVSCQDVG